MPIGDRYEAQGAALPVFPGAGGPGAAGAAPGGPGTGCAGCGAAAGVHFWQMITATALDVTNLVGYSLQLPVAELPAPPAGYQYVIERAIVRGGAALGLYVIVGDLNSDNLVDGIPTTLPDFAVMADGESAIRVPPGQPLRFVWLGNTTDRFTARIQYRQEPA